MVSHWSDGGWNDGDPEQAGFPMDFQLGSEKFLKVIGNRPHYQKDVDRTEMLAVAVAILSVEAVDNQAGPWSVKLGSENNPSAG